MATTEWIDIIPDTAQDEVCDVAWKIVEALEKRTLGLITEVTHDGGGGAFTQELHDLLELTDHASTNYRSQAERVPRFAGLLEMADNLNKLAAVGYAAADAKAGGKVKVILP